MKRFILTAAMALGVSLLPVAAFAGPITLSLGLQEAGVNGGAISTVSTNTQPAGVSYSTTYGDWTLVLTGGSSAYPQSPFLDLSANLTCGSCASPLNIWLTGTGFNTNGVDTGLNLRLTGSATGGSGSFSETALYGGATQLFGGTTLGTLNAPGDLGVVIPGATGAYSLTIENTFANGANYSTDSSLTTPEPASLALLGTGLLGLGLFGFKRKAFSFGPQA